MVKIWEFVLSFGWFCAAILIALISILIILDVIPLVLFLIVIAFFLCGGIASVIFTKYDKDSKQIEEIIEHYELGNLNLEELNYLAQGDLILQKYLQGIDEYNQFIVIDSLNIEIVPEGKIKCPNCDEIIEEGLIFCPECGNRIPRFLQYNLYSTTRNL